MSENAHSIVVLWNKERRNYFIKDQATKMNFGFKKKKGVGYLLILLRLVFATLAALFMGYGIITQDFRLSPYMILFLGLAPDHV